MLKVRTKDFGVRCTSSFAVPRPYSTQVVNDFVSSCFKEFSALGVNPTSFSQTVGDGLFGYAVACSFLGGKVSLVLNGQSLHTALLNGQNEKDAGAMVLLLLQALRSVPGQDQMTHAFNVFAHTEFEEGGKVDDFMGSLTGLISSKQLANFALWSGEKEEESSPMPKRVRLDIGRSEFFENAVYLSWSFEMRGSFRQEDLTAGSEKLWAIARQVGIEFAK